MPKMDSACRKAHFGVIWASFEDFRADLCRGRRRVTKFTERVYSHNAGLAGLGAKCWDFGRMGRSGRDGGCGEVWCGCDVPSVWMCYGVGRERFRVVGRKLIFKISD